MDELGAYGSDSPNSGTSPHTKTTLKDVTRPILLAKDAKKDENLADQWEAFEKLVGESAFVSDPQEKESEPPPVSVETKAVSSEKCKNGSEKKKAVQSSSESSSSEDGSSSDSSSSSSSSSSSEEETKKSKSKKSIKVKKVRSRSKEKRIRKRKQSETEDSSEEETSRKRKSLKERSLSPKAKVRKSRSRSKSRRSRSRSRDRRRHRTHGLRRRRRRSHSRGKHRRRRSGSRSRRSKSRHRSKSKERSELKDVKSQDGTDNKKSNSPERRRSRSRSRQRKRRSERRRRSSSRHRRRHEDRRPRRRRSRDRHGRDRRRSPSPRTLKSQEFDPKRRNEPLNFKEKLKQSLMEVQKKAAAGKLDVSKMDTNSKGMETPNEKPSNIPLGSDNPLAAMAAGGQVTPQQALLQTMAAMHQKAQELTGVAVPKYYNPAAVNPLKYAEQVQKRKLLWSKKDKEVKEAAVEEPSTSGTTDDKTAQWAATQFVQDQDGKMTAKFRKLMGIKETESGSNAENLTEEQMKRRQEMFQRLDQEYELARMSTHTHRGVGLGFASATQQVPQFPK